MEQDCQLSGHGNHRSLLGIFSSSLCKLQSPSDQELRRDGQFVVSMAGAAYDAKWNVQIEKVRQEVFIENSRFADFGVGADVYGGNFVSSTG